MQECAHQTTSNNHKNIIRNFPYKEEATGTTTPTTRRFRQVHNVREERTESESGLELPQRFYQFHFDTIVIDSGKRNEAIVHLVI